MDNNNQMESHLRTSFLHQSTVPKILVPSSSGFIRTAEQVCLERPMTLNAWTQTTNEDAEYLRAEYHHHHEQNRIYHESENERRLLEKIRALEKTLQVQAELLSQIHATSAGGRNSLHLQQQHHQQQQHHSEANIISPNSTSLINQFQQEPKETIKYTIIAEAGNGDDNDEPIEIHLAEDDGALNLNSSADSGRLEIYIADDHQQQQQQEQQQQQMDIKSESLHSEDTKCETPALRAVLAPDPQTTMSAVTVTARAMTPSSQSINQVTSTAPVTTTTAASTAAATQLNKRPKIEASPSPNVAPAVVSNVYISQNYASGKIIQESSSSKCFNYSSRKPAEVLTPMATYSNSNAIPLSAAEPTPKRKLSTLKVKKNILHSPDQDTQITKFSLEKAMVSIGPNNTLIPEEIYASIPWKSASIATRRLLMTIFDRTTLATHSMTGKPSPAFKDQNKPLKKMLDRTKVEDILYAVTTKCNVTEKEVRNAITTKCADENKMMKLQMGKNQNLGSVDNKENISV